jgi:hypothetical protein
MTRGTLAFVTINQETGCFEINSSTEFNGDIGYDMCRGNTTLRRLKKVKTIEEFKDVVWKTIEDFEYTDEFDGGKDGKLVWTHSCENRGMDIDHPYSIDGNILSKVFNYSDYEYLMNLSDKSFFFKDRNGHTIELLPSAKEVAILDFCYYIGSMIDGKMKMIPVRDR